MEIKVRRGTKARPTMVHNSKKRYKRADKYKGVIYDDWYEQQIQELIDGNADSDDPDGASTGDLFESDGTIGDEDE